MTDRFKNHQDDDVREIVLAYEEARNNGTRRYFDVDEMEIVLDFYLEQNDLDHMQEALRYAERLFPDANSITLRRAHLLCARGNYDRARPLVENVLHLEPENNDAHYALGVILSTMGEPEQAIRHYLTAARDDYALDAIYGNVADEYHNMQRDEEAIHYYKKALEINHREERSILNLLDTFEQTDRLIDSENFFSKFVEEHPHNEIGWYALAMTYSFLSLLEKAVDAAEYALSINKNLFSAYICIANCYMEMHDPASATSILLEALPYTETPDFVYYMIGTVYHDSGNMQTAAAYFRKALTTDPNYGDALRGLASCYSAMNDYQSSVACIERAIANMPPLAEFHYDAAHFNDQAGNLEEAEQHFKKTLELDPTQENYWLDYGLFLIKTEQNEEAISLMEDAAEQNFDSENCSVILAAAHFKAGHLKAFLSIAYPKRILNASWYKKLVDILSECADYLPPLPTNNDPNNTTQTNHDPEI